MYRKRIRLTMETEIQRMQRSLKERGVKMRDSNRLFL
jgi:hypothetical protein